MSSIILHNDALLRAAVREQLLYRPSYMTINETMLHEGISGGAVKDAIQFVVGAGAEYGLGGLTLPAAGSGLAIGPTVETMVDAAFAAEEVAGTIDAVSSIGSKLGEYGALWGEARAAYGGDLQAYYQTLVKIVRQALADLGKKGKDKVEEIAEKLQGAIENLISRLVGALKQGIKLVIPDATIGLVAAKAFGEGLEALSESAFDLLAGAVNKVKMLRDFVSDPSIAVGFFKDVFAQVVELMIAGAKKLEDMSWVNAIMAGPTGAALKKLGPTGLEKAASIIKDKTPTIIKVIDGVLTVLVPTAITAVGLFQILMTDDWKEENETSDEQSGSKEKKEQLAAGHIRRNSMLISRGRLRDLIKESILKEEMIPIIVNPYEDLDTMNRVANYALTNDIKGALADDHVNYENLDLDLDEMRGWVKRVGEENWMSDNAVVPDNWDANKVHQFMEDLENAWYDHRGQKMDADHKAGSNVKEREIIGSALTVSYVSPEEIKGITFQIRRKGGNPSNINLETDTQLGNIRAEDATRAGFTLDDIIDVLRNNGAKERKKQKPIRHTPPLYDHYIREGLTEMVTDDEFVDALRSTWDAVRIDVGIRNPTWEDKADEAVAMFGTYDPRLADQFNALPFKDQDVLLKLAFDSRGGRY